MQIVWFSCVNNQQNVYTIIYKKKYCITKHKRKIDKKTKLHSGTHIELIHNCIFQHFVWFLIAYSKYTSFISIQTKTSLKRHLESPKVQSKAEFILQIINKENYFRQSVRGIYGTLILSFENQLHHKHQHNEIKMTIKSRFCDIFFLLLFVSHDSLFNKFSFYC